MKNATKQVNNREDDAKLAERILNGEEKALLEFYKKYAPKISFYIKTKIENVNDGEEILQDSLLACIEALRDYSGRASLATFLFAITRNKVVDYYRKKKIKQVLFSRLPGFEELVSRALSPEQELDEKQVRERIKATLDKMEGKSRIVLIMKYEYGLPVAEMAGKLKESVKAVESRLFRARKVFVKLYDNY